MKLKPENKFTLLIILIFIALIYFTGVYYYNGKFLPMTSMNGEHIGGKTLKEANNELASNVNWKNITIKNNDKEITSISSDDIKYEYIDSPALYKVYNKSNHFLWFMSFLNKQELEVEPLYIYDLRSLRIIVSTSNELNGTLKNAEVVYSDDENQYVISPHAYGLNINRDNLIQIIKRNIDNKNEELDIESYIEMPDVLENDEKLIEAKNTSNEYINIKLTYNYGDRTEIINDKLIKDWIVITDDLNVEFDKELMREHIVKLAQKYDTFGTSREFKTTSGKTIMTNGGSYGWMTHRANTVDALVEHIINGEDKIIDPVYSYTAVSRNKNDLGDSYVEIDINNQMVYVYIKNKLEVKTPTVTGNLAIKGHATPRRVDPITYKTTNVTLRGPGYASPVNYWMPFNGNIGLHDADWRTSFGGEIYRTNGSHGCINLPPAIAGQVYELVFQGMPVIVH